MNNTVKKLTSSVAVVILLSLCLVVTSAALIYSIVSVDDNVFTTGTVRINLNDKQPVIAETEFLFEPGMTVEKDFFVENLSTCQVYYKLYFQNVSGGLADVLEVEVRDGDKVLHSGTPRTLDRTSVTAADDTLSVGERRDLQIRFHFPEEAGNAAQNTTLTFDFAADAVQTKNNPDKSFE